MTFQRALVLFSNKRTMYRNLINYGSDYASIKLRYIEVFENASICKAVVTFLAVLKPDP